MHFASSRPLPRAVQRLVNAGLAERRPSNDDGRVVQVEITEAGREVFEAVAARRAELLTFILRSTPGTSCPSSPTCSSASSSPSTRSSPPTTPTPEGLAQDGLGYGAGDG
ncbi:MAG: winged helix DNA-binding protein [Acidimicrobiaceae bacterium]|nr:winged helix DNA-binding protein [Acidimicrobiaceae bacterium]